MMDVLNGPSLAGFTVLGALTLPGFLYESRYRVAMGVRGDRYSAPGNNDMHGEW